MCARKRLLEEGNIPSRAMGLSSTNTTLGTTSVSSAAENSVAISVSSIWAMCWNVLAAGVRFPVSQFATADRVTCSRSASSCWERPRSFLRRLSVSPKWLSIFRPAKPSTRSKPQDSCQYYDAHRQGNSGMECHIMKRFSTHVVEKRHISTSLPSNDPLEPPNASRPF